MCAPLPPPPWNECEQKKKGWLWPELCPNYGENLKGRNQQHRFVPEGDYRSHQDSVSWLAGLCRWKERNQKQETGWTGINPRMSVCVLKMGGISGKMNHKNDKEKRNYIITAFRPSRTFPGVWWKNFTFRSWAVKPCGQCAAAVPKLVKYWGYHPKRTWEEVPLK